MIGFPFWWANCKNLSTLVYSSLTQRVSIKLFSITTYVTNSIMINHAMSISHFCNWMRGLTHLRFFFHNFVIHTNKEYSSPKNTRHVLHNIILLSWTWLVWSRIGCSLLWQLNQYKLLCVFSLSLISFYITYDHCLH